MATQTATRTIKTDDDMEAWRIISSLSHAISSDTVNQIMSHIRNYNGVWDIVARNVQARWLGFCGFWEFRITEEVDNDS